jgi:hypothetical protein
VAHVSLFAGGGFRNSDQRLYAVLEHGALLYCELEQPGAQVMPMALTQKAKQMAFPVEELGPGAGLAQYPTRPGDFRPPEHLNGFV